MSVPNTFATATSPIPLASLDANFAYYDAAFSIVSTALSLIANPTLSAGTANGVTYLNGSKVLTTGSALTFDGTNINVTNGVLTSQSATGGNGYVGAIGTGMRLVNLHASSDIDLIGNGGINLSTAGNFPFKFSIAGSEAMRLTSTGLGIGTSNPTSALTVGAGGIARFNRADNNTYNEIKYVTSGDLFYFNQANGGAYQFNITGTEQMRLTSTGLGIGTSSPLAKLDVAKTSSDTISRTNASGAFGDYQSLGAGLLMQQTLSAPYGFALQAANAANSLQFPLLLNPSGGNVGIGTSSPVSKLDVAETVTIKRVTSGNNMDLNFYNGSGVATAGNVARIRADGDGISNDYGALSFWTGRINSAAIGEKMRLDSLGNLGLGVTPFAWGSGYKALQINNGGLVTNVGGTFTAVTANAYFDGSSYRYASTAAASLYRQNAGVHDWQIAPSGTAGNAISFTQAATLTAAGNFVVGDTASDFRLGSFVESGANRDMLIAAVKGVTNGFSVKWNHSTTTTRVNIQNLPTSATGLASGDLYVLAGALMVA